MTQNDQTVLLINKWTSKALAASRKAHKILAVHESSSSRVVIMEDLLKTLASLPVDIQDYFKEAVNCLEQDWRRASIVLVWAGFFSVMTEKLYGKGESNIRFARPKWKFSDLTELLESYPESQIIDAYQAAKLIKPRDSKLYQGQLTKRNQCAHPTLFKPSLNVAIGYVDEMLRQTIEYL
jgi:hypothetical protein